MLNTVKIKLADVSSVSPSSEQSKDQIYYLVIIIWFMRVCTTHLNDNNCLLHNVVHFSLDQVKECAHTSLSRLLKQKGRKSVKQCPTPSSKQKVNKDECYKWNIITFYLNFNGTAPNGTDRLPHKVYVHFSSIPVWQRYSSTVKPWPNRLTSQPKCANYGLSRKL